MRIEATPKEIADLVVALQDQRVDTSSIARGVERAIQVVLATHDTGEEA